MSKKIEKNLKDVQLDYAQERLERNVAKNLDDRRSKAIYTLGGIGAINGLNKALDSQMMRTLEYFQKEKMYEDLGFANFVDFLQNSDLSPMSKNQYYDRKDLLEKEGDIMFDLLNGVKMSVHKRKLLGAGNIQLEGDKVFIKMPDSDDETEIELNDRTRLLETLTALADRSTVLQEKNKQQLDKLDKAAETIKEKDDEIERVKADKLANLNPHSNALLNVAAAMNQLIEEAAKLNAIEKEKFAPRTFEMIAGKRAELAEAYGRESTEIDLSAIETKDKSIGDIINEINDDELVEMI